MKINIFNVMKKRKNLFFVVVLLAAFAQLFLGCSNESRLTEKYKEQKNNNIHENSDRNKIIHLSEETKKIIEIETVKAEYRPFKLFLQAVGKVIAPQNRIAIVSYVFPARISKIYVRIGDWVKKGQKLIELESVEVGEAKSIFYKAIADYELAKANYEREERLFKQDIGARKNLLAAEAEYKVAQANLNAAEKKLHLLGFNEEQIKILIETHQISPVIVLYAPIAGKIIKNNAFLGAMVDQTTEILTIMDPTVLWIDAEIYEKDIDKIKIAQEVEISVLAFKEEKFSGKVSFISDTLNEETRTITVRTEVINNGYKLKPGMFADIKIFIDKKNRVIALPERAILDDRDRKIVFLKKGDGFLVEEVEVGSSYNGYTEILKGVKKGDEVVVKGNYQLKSELHEEVLKKGHVH
ncbi:MAG: efflux RND transporter periplasmic adaptor subunit [Acidobacteriota bacterium]